MTQSGTDPMLSPDGRYWWNGERWVNAISDDQRWRFDGTNWVPNEPPARPMTFAEVLDERRRTEDAAKNAQRDAQVAARDAQQRVMREAKARADAEREENRRAEREKAQHVRDANQAANVEAETEREQRRRDEVQRAQLSRDAETSAANRSVADHMTELSADQTSDWPVVQTDAGAVTLAPVPALIARAAEWHAWAAKATLAAQSMRAQAEDRFAAAAAILVDHPTEWPIPADLQASVQQARALHGRIAADDEQDIALKAQESTAGFLGRVGVRHQQHGVEQDRNRLAAQLRTLLIPIGRSAPSTSLPAADAEHGAAIELELQARGLETQMTAAQQRAGSWEEEAGKRAQAEKTMGFDALFEAAQLITSGPNPVASPLILKAGEAAYQAVPATLARMTTKTHYVGASSGFSFPIGHTGIRYRVGSYSGRPVQQQILSKLDHGTLVLTNVRLAYIGATKSVSTPLAKIMHVELHNDGLTVLQENRQNPDFYLTNEAKHILFYLNWFLAKQSGS